jgi:succinoglycan biosynthesis transport protein ExoP
VDTRPGHQTKELVDYLLVLRRRKYHVIAPFFVITLIMSILAYVLPPVYRAGATILIESQEIPPELVATTVTAKLQEHVQGVMLRLMTQQNLWSLINKLDLYPEERRLYSPEEVVALMRDQIGLEIVDFQATSPEEGDTGKDSTGLATIALKVSFDADTPEISQTVANELAKIFLEENRSARAERASTVSKFLGEEADKLRLQIAKLEAELADFKRKNVDQLPELKDFNLKLYEQTQDKLSRLEQTIRALEDRKINLESQLAITNPYKDILTDSGKRLQSGEERLNVLMADFLYKSSIYSPDHPDIKKLRREIASLEGQIGSSNGVSQLVEQVTLLREQLAEARQRYTEEHPDIKKLKQSIKAIENELHNYALPRASEFSKAPAAPNNPTYVSLKSQLDTINANLEAEKAIRDQTNKKLQQYETRVQQTPIVERKFLTLNRDYDNALAEYKEIKNKQHEAQLGFELESEAKGERFTLVEAASLPYKPYKPNRRALLFIGAVLGFISGIGIASVAEYLDRTVRGVKGIIAVFHAPPLASIPYVKNSEDTIKTRKQNLTLIGILIISLMVILAMAMMHLNTTQTDNGDSSMGSIDTLKNE